MNEKQHIASLIKNVASKNFSKANNNLAAIVNEKLKQRIRVADQKLSNAAQK